MREPEIMGGAEMDGLHAADCRCRRDGDGEHGGQEDQKDRGRIGDSEPENGQRDPGDGRDRPQGLDQRVEGRVRLPEPAHEEPQRHAR